MKIKLIEPGYENYTGYFGQVLFECSVSTHPVSESQARFLGSILRVAPVDENGQEGAALQNAANEQFQQAMKNEAYLNDAPTQAELDARAAAEKKDEVSEEPKSVGVVYTREQLEAVADKSGIKGLREIADTLNVKGSDIKKLIKLILDAQVVSSTKQEPKVEG